MRQQTDYPHVGLLPAGRNPRHRSPVPPVSHTCIRHGGMCHRFALHGRESGLEIANQGVPEFPPEAVFAVTLPSRFGKTAPLVEHLREVFNAASRPTLCLILALVMFPHLLLGQENGSLTGKVAASGGELAGVKVTLVNQQTNKKQEVETAEDGRFSFTDLASGTYLVRIEASGFEPYNTSIQVGTEKLNPLKIKLKLQTVEEEITVHADTPDDRLSPESNPDSMRIDETFFGGLPLEVDYLQPFIDTFISPAAQGNEGTSVVVDGVDGGDLDMPSTAIRTLKINRNPYSAEFQHPGNARAEIATKHGRKHRYEGTLALFARNSVFDARNAFAGTNPDLNRRFVEGSLGGPLPGKTGTFFVAGERLLDDQSAVVNAPDTVTLTGPLITNVPAPQRRDHLFGRAHWSLTTMQTLSVNYAFTDQSSHNEGVGGLILPEQGIATGHQTHRVQLIESAILSPRFRSQLIIVFKNQKERSGNPANGPEIVVDGEFTGGPSQSYSSKERRAFDAQETATYVHGKHTFSFGGTARSEWNNVTDATNFGGTFEFGSLDQYRAVIQQHLGAPILYSVNQGNPAVSFLAQQTSGFVEDELRALPNLSVTFGLRYDWQNTLDDRKDLAPRLALAYSPGNRKKTVVRAGTGIFYDNLPRTTTQDALLLDGVRVREIDISNPSYPDPFLGGQLVSQPISTTRVASGAQSPYLIQTSAAVEQEIWGGNWLSLEYSFLHGVHLFRLRDVNAPFPSGGGVRPNPNFFEINEIQSTAFLRGHALTLTFRGGLGKRFKAYGQYIFSKYINDTSSQYGTFLPPADNYDLRAEIAPADFDRRHRVNFAGIVLLPFGTRMGSLFSAATGAPYNITTGFDENGDGVANDRPPGVTRNTGRQPGTVQFDLRLSKVFSLENIFAREHHNARRTMELGVDAFNAINRTNVSSIVGVASSSLFGQADSASLARTLQLSVKYSF